MAKFLRNFIMPDLRRLQTQISLYDTAFAGQLLVLSFATVIFFDHVPPSLLFGWAGLHLGNLYLRYRLTGQIKTLNDPKDPHLQPLLGLYSASLIVTGLLWALMPFFTVNTPPLYLFLIYALVISLTFGATMFIGPLPTLFFSYILPMNLTMFGELIIKTHPVFHAAALFLIVNFFFATKAAQMHAKNLMTMLDQKEQAMALKEHFEHKANTDRLTGLPNREKFFSHFEWMLRDTRKSRHPFALFFIDVNDFKGINDTYGHDVGDLVLKTVAERLRHALREEDLLARLSGDEFVMIVKEINAKERAKEIAKRIKHLFDEPIHLEEGDYITVSLSIGIALYPDHGITAKTLMRHADEAMYYAKRNHKPYAFFK